MMIEWECLLLVAFGFCASHSIVKRRSTDPDVYIFSENQRFEKRNLPQYQFPTRRQDSTTCTTIDRCSRSRWFSLRWHQLRYLEHRLHLYTRNGSTSMSATVSICTVHLREYNRTVLRYWCTIDQLNLQPPTTQKYLFREITEHQSPWWNYRSFVH